MSTRRIFHGKARNNPRLFSHKKESSENEGIREVKKTTNTTCTIFYNQVTLAGKLVAILSSRSCCFGCLPCRRIVYTRSVFCPREALLLVVKIVLVVFPTQQAVSRNFVREELLLVVKVVLVVFPTQQAASKQHDTTFVSLHLRIKKLYSYE